MTTVVKAADAAQFLSLVPRMLGFRPRDSLVLVPFRGSRSVGALRFDLPAPGAPDAPAGIAATVVGMVCRIPDVDRFALIVYADAALDAAREARAPLVDAVRTRADECGLPLVDELLVGLDAWAAYDDPGRGGPSDMFDEVDGDPGVAADQASAAELPEVDPARRECTARALQALRGAVALLCGPDDADTGDPASDPPGPRIDPCALEAAVQLDDLPALFERALSWDAASLDPSSAAVLTWCLARPAVRDIALVQWCAGSTAGDEALDAQLRWEEGEEYPSHLAMFLWGEGERPVPTRLHAALALVRSVAALAPPEAQAGPLATAAWLSWALGRSTHAERYARAATAAEPEHGLAEIVLSFVGAGHLPDWAFQRA